MLLAFIIYIFLFLGTKQKTGGKLLVCHTVFPFTFYENSSAYDVIIYNYNEL